jgi:hypothetical protein
MAPGSRESPREVGEVPRKIDNEREDACRRRARHGNFASLFKGAGRHRVGIVEGRSEGRLDLADESEPSRVGVVVNDLPVEEPAGIIRLNSIQRTLPPAMTLWYIFYTFTDNQGIGGIRV